MVSWIICVVMGAGGWIVVVRLSSPSNMLGGRAGKASIGDIMNANLMIRRSS